jgi:hypothetical protein
VALDTFIPVFHHWIQAQRLDDVLIDVADYRHVPHGPGVLLIGHDAQYAMDQSEGRLGLLYSRRREFQGKLRFRTDTLQLRINDRLLAPNTKEAYADLRRHLHPFLAQLYPEDQVTIEHRAESSSRLTVAIEITPATDVGTLLARLSTDNAVVGVSS